VTGADADRVSIDRHAAPEVVAAVGVLASRRAFSDVVHWPNAAAAGEGRQEERE
jgi:hypothetical protein